MSSKKSTTSKFSASDYYAKSVPKEYHNNPHYQFNNQFIKVADSCSKGQDQMQKEVKKLYEIGTGSKKK